MSWTAVIVGGAALLSAVVGSKSSSKAADATSKAADKASEAQLEMFYQNREDLAPWRNAGVNALDTLQGKLTTGPLSATDYTKSADYEFVTGEGEKAINRALASRGQYDSGKALKSLTKYNQDYALGDYQNYLDNWYNSLNPLMTVAGFGQNATTTTTQQGQDTANNVANNILYKGSNNASSYIDQGNAASSAIDSGMSNYLMYKYLTKRNPQVVDNSIMYA